MQSSLCLCNHPLFSPKLSFPICNFALQMFLSFTAGHQGCPCPNRQILCE